MPGLSRAEVAARAGVDIAYVDELIAGRVLAPVGDGTFSVDDVRRIGILRALQDAGLPLDALAAGFAPAVTPPDFMSTPEHDRDATLSSATFAQASARPRAPV